jgi:hypothetical protein
MAKDVLDGEFDGHGMEEFNDAAFVNTFPGQAVVWIGPGAVHCFSDA